MPQRKILWQITFIFSLVLSWNDSDEAGTCENSGGTGSAPCSIHHVYSSVSNILQITYLFLRNCQFYHKWNCLLCWFASQAILRIETSVFLERDIYDMFIDEKAMNCLTKRTEICILFTVRCTRTVTER